MHKATADTQVMGADARGRGMCRLSSARDVYGGGRGGGGGSSGSSNIRLHPHPWVCLACCLDIDSFHTHHLLP
jgi:hypothetical protein